MSADLSVVSGKVKVCSVWVGTSLTPVVVVQGVGGARPISLRVVGTRPRFVARGWNATPGNRCLAGSKKLEKAT